MQAISPMLTRKHTGEVPEIGDAPFDRAACCVLSGQECICITEIFNASPIVPLGNRNRSNADIEPILNSLLVATVEGVCLTLAILMEKNQHESSLL